MAYTFPMPLAQFFQDLPIRAFSFDLGDALEMNETGGGEILTADIGNRLWEVNCEIAPGDYASIEQIKAKLSVLRYAGRSLIAHSMPLYMPQSDPSGAILGSSIVTLNHVYSNNREIQLAGLPANYKLTTGDFLGFQYGSNPARYALHQLANGGQANGAGLTGAVEVSSFVRTGWVAGAAVKLIRPEIKMIVKPGSVDVGKSSAQFTDAVKFTLIQTLR